MSTANFLFVRFEPVKRQRRKSSEQKERGLTLADDKEESRTTKRKDIFESGRRQRRKLREKKEIGL